jgi:pyruvate/2-oxoglutarate dehydrogenase complex dihydrolipoamide acyltransferase (E2) component
VSEFEFLLPDVGEGLAEAEVVHWMVREGGTIHRMEPMVEIETAKSTVEIPSPVTGTLVRHGAPEGTVLDIGAVLAVLSSTAPMHPALEAPPKEAVEAPDRVDGVAAARRTSTTAAADDIARRRVPAAPTVRRLAAELGVALADVAGTGPGGRVLGVDVETAAAQGNSLAGTTAPSPVAASTTPGDRTEKLSPMRLAIMGTLMDAWSKVPLITDMRDADVTSLVQARAALIEELTGEKVSYTTLFTAAALAALRRHPVFNASLNQTAGTVSYHSSVNLGVAISVRGGLSVGVVRDADSLTLKELGQAVSRVAEKARTGSLSSEESSGATFTVSSFGQFGGWYGTPLVVPPQVAIAGFGPIKDKVVAIDGAPVVRATLAMSISADHRLIDGAELSTFCSTIERLIAEPVRMLGY